MVPGLKGIGLFRSEGTGSPLDSCHLVTVGASCHTRNWKAVGWKSRSMMQTSQVAFLGVYPFPEESCKSQRVQSTYIIVECRVSVLGIVIMIWESIPHNST